MFKYLKSFLKPKGFGLDLSHHSVKVFQLPDKFARLELSSITPKQNKRKAEKNKIKIVRKALKQAKIKSKYVIASLPETKSFIRFIPNSAANTATFNVKKEIEANIPLPIDKIYYSVKKTPEGLLIAATDKEAVNDRIKFLEKVGLKILALEPESIAIARALVKGDETVLIIDLGETRTLFIICSHQIVRFTSSRDRKNLIKEIKAYLKEEKERNMGKILTNVAQEKKSFIKQVKEYLYFYQSHNGGVSKIILCGGRSLEGDLVEELKKAFSLPVEVGKPIIKTKIGKRAVVYATAIGLALRDEESL
jgi:Tfp pilus assembly PilM family ATPase